jgi:RimK family alpha-L-glutamate ligase
MKRRACILGEPTGWHARRLASLLEIRAFETAIVPWRCLSADVAPHGEAFGPPEFARADVVAVRGMPGTSPAESRLEEVIFRMDVLARLAAHGTPVVNPPKALEFAIDKYLSLTLLAAAGVPVPRTIVVQDAAHAMAAWEALGGDCVAKPLFGSRGRGLLRCRSAADAGAAVTATSGVAYLQEFIRHDGWDVRALVVGEHLFAMRRDAAPGHWITNLGSGGSASRIDLAQDQEAVARRAASAVGASLAGVDMAPAADGRLVVLEVNGVPGWRGIEALLGDTVGETVADHIASLASV